MILWTIRWPQALGKRLFRLLSAPRFGSWGERTWLLSPGLIQGAGDIHLGNDVLIQNGTNLAAVARAGSPNARLEIGDGCALGFANHIFSTRRIVLGPKVLTANGVYISDNVHAYEEIGVAVIDQPIRQLAEISIGEGSWIGHNACILGASIGRHSVIGANAVVLDDIPDFAVAVGAPARVVRRYDHEAGRWRRTGTDGRFLDDEEDRFE